jgi:hypothetical protein
MHIKYANRLMVHTICLFRSLSILQTAIIASILPMAISGVITTYEFLNENIDAEHYAIRLGTSAVNISSSIALSVGLSNVIDVKSGFAAVFSLKTGVLKFSAVAATIKTSIAIKAGIITLTIGASTIKAMGIGLAVMVVGALIILIEKLILKALKNEQGKVNKPMLYDNIYGGSYYDTQEVYYHKESSYYDSVGKSSYYDSVGKTSYYDSMDKSSVYEHFR